MGLQWPVPIPEDLADNPWFKTLPHREQEAGLDNDKTHTCGYMITCGSLSKIISSQRVSGCYFLFKSKVSVVVFKFP